MTTQTFPPGQKPGAWTTTPRTDALVQLIVDDRESEAALANLARSLERENAELREALLTAYPILADFVAYISAGDDAPLQAMLDEARAALAKTQSNTGAAQ
jgi:hypothetical protein